MTRMWTIATQTYEFFKEALTLGTAITTVSALAILGYMIERRERSLENRRLKSLKRSLKRVPMKPVSRRRARRPRIPAVSPCLPMRRKRSRRQSWQSVTQDHSRTLDLAIENAVGLLWHCDLTGATAGELYEVICQHHPTNKPDAHFLSAVTDNLPGGRGYDWPSFLRKRSIIYRHKQVSLLKHSSTSSQMRLSSPGHESGCDNDSTAQASRETPCLTEDNQTEKPYSSVKQSGNTLVDQANTHATPLSVEQNHLMRGGLDPRDMDTSKRLIARLAQEENEVMCTQNYSLESTIQGWRLVSRKELPLAQLFQDPEHTAQYIPERLHITWNALQFLVEAIPADHPGDEAILNTIIGFSSDLGHDKDVFGRELVDVEYMEPYLHPSELNDFQKEYWNAHDEWKAQALSDLGVAIDDKGFYITAGEAHFSRMGWSMEVPGQVERRHA